MKLYGKNFAITAQPGIAAPLANVPADYEKRLVKMDFKTLADVKVVTSGAGAAASRTSARAIEQFVTVGADVIFGHTADKRNVAPIAETKPMQHRSACGAGPGGRRLHVVHDSSCTSLELRVLPRGNCRHRDDALLQTVEIDLNVDGFTLATLRRRSGLIVRIVGW